MGLQELLDLSTFANYGKDVDKEIMSEVFTHILTISKSVSYYRQMGTTLKRAENSPLTIQRSLLLGLEIVDSVQIYNDNIISDKYERQVALPFDSIEFNADNQPIGELSINALYYPLKDLKENQFTI